MPRRGNPLDLPASSNGSLRENREIATPVCALARNDIFFSWIPATNCLHDFHKMDLHFLCRCGIISVLALEDAEC